MISPFENPLFLIPISSEPLFMITGLILFKFPPKKINSLYGYRTSSSMQNSERCDFAQRYAAIEMMKQGGLLTISAVSGYLYYPTAKIAMLLGLALMITILIILTFRVEKAIKREFKSTK